jgi:hypothetical protein
MTMEVCMTAEALAFANLSRLVDDTCKWTKRVVTPTRIDVAFTCASMSAESSTEVVDDEHVRVAGTTTLSSGGQLQTISSSENWTFLRSDCPRG